MARRKNVDLSDLVAEHIVALVDAITAMVRQDTAREIADLVGGSRGLALGRTRRRRILPCIAPGCKNPSKGPRFHYLCDEHRNAPRKDWEAWQEAKRQKGPDAGASRRASASKGRLTARPKTKGAKPKRTKSAKVKEAAARPKDATPRAEVAPP